MQYRTLIPTLFLGISLAMLPGPVAEAQQDSSREDAGFLENLIQNALGGDGRTVRVVGLSGLLSSEATIEQIEIADDDGPWLQISNVALDWRRLALLRGRLEVNALTVGEIDVLRTPLPPPNAPPKLAADPTAEPEPFSLPDLPVAVNVAQLSVGAIRLGEPVLGQAVALSLSGAAQLADGQGSANLSLVRIDGLESTYRLEAGFTNETNVVLVDLDVSEAPGGLITTLTGIPDSPSLTLTVTGEDPLSDFTADLALRTDGEDRLTGQIGLADVAGTTPPERTITANVAGDVADLFLPDYRDFFGRRVELVLRARQGQAIGLDVQDLLLTTRGLRLTGTADLSPAFLPQTLDLQARLGTESGLPVVLPIPGPPTLVHDADLAIVYDEAAGDTFAVTLAGSGFMRADGLLIDSVDFSTQGQLTKAAPTDITAALADIAGQVTGFSATDAALSEAVGDDLTVNGRVDWQRQGPLTLSGFEIAAGDLMATGRATVTGLETQAIAVSADIAAQAGDLDRFSAISGQALGGQISADVVAQYDTVSGAFDVTLDGESRDLVLGAPAADGLLAGRVVLGVSAARTADGIAVDRLRLDGPRIDITGSGGIDPSGWPRAVALNGRIGAQTGAPVVLPAPGPRMTLQSAVLDLSYDPDTGDDFSLDLLARDFQREGEAAMQQAELTARGQLARQDTTVTDVTARITAALTGLTATDPALNAAISPGARIDSDVAWNAGDDTLTLTGFNLSSGDLTVSADATVNDLTTPDLAVDASIRAQTGPLGRFSALAGQTLSGQASASGTASFATQTGFFDVDLQARGQDLAVGIPQADQLLRGDVRIVARAAQDASGLTIDRVELRSDEVSLLATGAMANDVTTIDLTAGLRNVGLLAPGFNGPLDVVATASNARDIWSVDGTLTGPRGTRAAVDGVVLRPDGTMGLNVTGALPLGLANQFILPRSIDGTAAFDLSVNGQPGLDAVSGTVTVEGARIAAPAARLALEDVGLQVALANSRATIDLDAALSSGGRIEVTGPVGLTGSFPADITARLIDIVLVDPSLYEVALGGNIAITGPLATGGDITGRIDIGRSEIRIPTAFGSSAALDGIEHVAEPAASRETRARAGLLQSQAASTSQGGGGPVFGLDILISAPREIFVRGRGLDVELGGRIAIGGTTAAVAPQGSLELIRGRLDILSQRLEFDRAEISLQGDLEPNIDMVASSSKGNVRSQIVIAGPVTDPEISLTSEPELPEDEVLAQLFFGKPVADLTPLELAQLASAINRLQGGGGGVFGFAREALGVDDLSLATDEDGNTAVTAGRYINERVYTDVTVGSDGTSEVQLNYEIRRDLSVRGRFTNDGETGIGLAFERDY